VTGAFRPQAAVGDGNVGGVGRHGDADVVGGQHGRAVAQGADVGVGGGRRRRDRRGDDGRRIHVKRVGGVRDERDHHDPHHQQRHEGQQSSHRHPPAVGSFARCWACLDKK